MSTHLLVRNFAGYYGVNLYLDLHAMRSFLRIQDGSIVVSEERFSRKEALLIGALMQAYPEECSYEMLQKTIERDSFEIDLSDLGIGRRTKSLTDTVSRVRQKLQSFGIHIVSIDGYGYNVVVRFEYEKRH